MVSVPVPQNMGSCCLSYKTLEDNYIHARAYKKGWGGLIFTKFEKVPRVLILHFSENGLVGVNFMPNRVSPDVFRKFSTCHPPPPPPPFEPKTCC